MAYLDHMPIGYQRYRRRDIVGAETPGKDAAYKAGFNKMLDLERLLHADGIQIFPGTDDPTGIGFVILRELELYTRIGMSPGEALRTATSQSARYLGRGELEGTIARGKIGRFLSCPRRCHPGHLADQEDPAWSYAAVLCTFLRKFTKHWV